MLLEANQRTACFYDSVRVLYPLIEPLLRGRRSQLIRMVNQYSKGDLLEVGIGNGTHLCSYEKHRVTGVDVSSGMLAEAAAHTVGSSVVLHRMDGEQLSFPPESFDYVVMSHVLTVTANADRMLGEAHRVLRQGGRLFVLNHETPRHGLRHWDRLVSCLGWMLKLRLWFILAETPAYHRFTEVSRQHCGYFGYYTITVLQK